MVTFDLCAFIVFFLIIELNFACWQEEEQVGAFETRFHFSKEKLNYFADLFVSFV